ncbi:MAG TPA: phosphatase PAP2 family protein [Aggregatilineaceae bacterium]|nr:phosphatase PAP2 family protein [Aggregatilineaceae bacterium]
MRLTLLKPLAHRSLDRTLRITFVLGSLCLLLFAVTAAVTGPGAPLEHANQDATARIHHALTPQTVALFKDISWFGSPGIWVTSLSVGALLLRRRQWLHVAIGVVTIGGGALLNELVKRLFERPRPSFPDAAVVERSYGFPSGHAMSSLLAYGLLLYYVWSTLRDRRVRLLLLSGLVLALALIGLSRVILGVHFVGDVIGGWTLGGAWLALWTGVMHAIRQKKGAGPPASTGSGVPS